MTNLKIKFGFFSLVAILAASVFLTSCEQSNTILGEQLEEVESIEQVTPESEFEGLLLPSNIVDMEETAIKTYLEGISSDELEQHVNDYVIMNFLTNEGLQDVAVITQWLCKITGGTMRCTKYRITFCS